MRKLVRRPKAIQEQKEEPVIKKAVVRYRKKKCTFLNADGSMCGRGCTGRGNVCVVHKDRGGRGITGSVAVPETQKPAIFGGTTPYNPVFHPMKYIELSCEGMSTVEIAAELGVSSVTLTTWKDKHAEFNRAFEIGQAMHEAWYIKQGKENLDNRFFQTPLYKFLTMNKLGWSDKVETKNTNQGVFGVLLVPGQMSMDEWERQNMIEDGEIIEGEVVEKEAQDE